MEELLNKLFESREVAHVLHLQTKSHAEHLALDAYYNEIIEQCGFISRSLSRSIWNS